MSDTALPHDMPSVYEPSLFGTYSKKIGMWLFLISDSLTFGALLYSYSYGRISTPSWPTPFHSESIVNATIMTAFLLTSSLTMVLGVRAAADGDRRMLRLWLLGTMICGTAFIVLHAREWGKLIAEGLTLPVFPKLPGQDGASEFANVSKTVPQFASTFFGLTGMHMLHVTIGVVAPTVLRAGDAVNVLSLGRTDANADIWQRLDTARLQIKMRACYCSVFDECWETNLLQTSAKRVRTCPVAKVPFSIPEGWFN